MKSVVPKGVVLLPTTSPPSALSASVMACRADLPSTVSAVTMYHCFPNTLTMCGVTACAIIRAFGMNAYTAANAGDLVVEDHNEESLGHEEVYVVLAGRATFTLGGEEFDAPAGTVVHLSDPKVQRVARAAEDGTRVLAVGGPPGEVYEPSPWESAFRVVARLGRAGLGRAFRDAVRTLDRRLAAQGS